MPSVVNNKELSVLLGLWLAALAASGFAPAERLTWLLEVVPVFIAIPIMALTRTSFTLTPLLYRLIFIHGLILILGGHYTYAQVPVGFWLQELFDFSRNHYDRIGHLAQGFIPAILAREILLRKTKLVPGKMLFYIVASICLAFSAFYELIEWWAAIAIGASAEAFLGTQGDIWDSQWDMFMALIGSISAQYLLEKWHDQQLKRL
jgi:putative membrane protein